MIARLAASLCLLLSWSTPALAAEAARRAPAAPQPAPAAVPEEESEYTPEKDVPAGSPEDLALWKGARQLTFDISSSRREAIRMNTRIRTERLKERLGEAAGKRPEAEAAPLEALQDRLMRTWNENYAVLSRRWPVDPIRGCNYPWLNFDSALRAAAAGSTRADVVTARKDVQDCVARGAAAVRAMRQSNEALVATLGEVDRTLSAVEPAKAAGVPASSARSGAPAARQQEGHGGHRDERKERGEHED